MACALAGATEELVSLDASPSEWASALLFLYSAAMEVDGSRQRPDAPVTILHLDLLSSFTALAPALAPALKDAPLETRQASSSIHLDVS